MSVSVKTSIQEPPADYREFLTQKCLTAPNVGFEVDDAEINPILKDHQRALVKWGVAGGRRAFFAQFGLGKTVITLETLRLLQQYAGGRGLICLPLGVRQEFKRDAEMLGMKVQFIRRTSEAEDPAGLYLTNYESVRDGKIEPEAFTAVSLDEASVLRSLGSKTSQVFLDRFENVRFRYVATATPAPNRYLELINYAHFLGIMDRGQAMTRFFGRNSEQAGDLQLYPHKKQEFWLWLNSWAIFLQRPSDLGYSDLGYDLPGMVVAYHEVDGTLKQATTERNGQIRLVEDATVGVSEAAKVRRDTLPQRITRMQEIIASDPDAHFLLWHDLEDERRAIEKAVPGVVSIYGQKDLDQREQEIIAFSDGEIKYLAPKAEIAGSGCNFQRHCHRAIFLGPDYKFNDFIQAIHRIHRFMQPSVVKIDIIYAETQAEVVRVLKNKWRAHTELTAAMSDVIREHGLNNLSVTKALTRSVGLERREERGQGWLVANNDTVLETQGMEDDSVDLIVTSIPFGNHYEYSASVNDFGHTDDDAHFFRQMDYLTPELKRVLKPGRIACIHTKDRMLYGSMTRDGCMTVNPFHMKTCFHYLEHGLAYMGMITILTDVVRENNQTYRLGWSEQCKDGTKMGVGSPEYVLLFRKLPTDRSNSYADEPVKKEKSDYSRARWQIDAHALWRSSGERLLTADELAAMGPQGLAGFYQNYSARHLYDYEEHVKVGEGLEKKKCLPASFGVLLPGSWHPDVWTDINRMLTLNGEQSRKGLEAHVCPLQWEIVDRLITRFSSEGELVYDPFGGLYTVPMRAITLNRRGRAVELNPDYHRDGVWHLIRAEREKGQLSMADLLSAGVE